MLRIATLLAVLVIAAPPAFAETSSDCASDNHEVAIPACTQLIQKNPHDATYYYNRGISYRETGKLDLAMADYTRAIELNPKYFEAYNNRGNLFMAPRRQQARPAGIRRGRSRSIHDMRSRTTIAARRSRT